MHQRRFVIAAILAATIFTTVFTTMTPFSMKDAEAQTLPSCPSGHERNVLGTCVLIVEPDPNGGDSDGTKTETEQEIGQQNEGSGESTNNNCALNSRDTTAAATVTCPIGPLPTRLPPTTP